MKKVLGDTGKGDFTSLGSGTCSLQSPVYFSVNLPSGDSGCESKGTGLPP